MTKLASTLRPLALTCSLACASSCAPGDDGGSVFTSSEGETDGQTGDGDGDPSGDGDGDPSGDGDGDPSGDGDGDPDGDGDGDPSGDGDGVKLDTLPPDTGADDGPMGDGNCDAVDLLFVVDNSVSMSEYQEALALAFPAFANTIVEILPPGTSIHVGVTSTTMGDSNSGSTNNCVATGDGGLPQDAFYETPDMSDNGLNGAQGRLYDPGDGVTYFQTSSDADAAEIAALEAWFSGAAQIGESGSQIEMSAAAAGWAADPANDATNAGFIRDNGAVLVLFFLQDEPDQTPVDIEGEGGGFAMLDKLSATKQVCGGANCIIGGGFINQFCVDQTPIGDLLDNLGAPPVIEELPGGFNPDPQQVAIEMEALLEQTLSNVIAQKCEEIEPVE